MGKAVDEFCLYLLTAFIGPCFFEIFWTGFIENEFSILDQYEKEINESYKIEEDAKNEEKKENSDNKSLFNWLTWNRVEKGAIIIAVVTMFYMLVTNTNMSIPDIDEEKCKDYNIFYQLVLLIDKDARLQTNEILDTIRMLSKMCWRSFLIWYIQYKKGKGDNPGSDSNFDSSATEKDILNIVNNKTNNNSLDYTNIETFGWKNIQSNSNNIYNDITDID